MLIMFVGARLHNMKYIMRRSKVRDYCLRIYIFPIYIVHYTLIVAVCSYIDHAELCQWAVYKGYKILWLIASATRTTNYNYINAYKSYIYMAAGLLNT